MKKTVLFFLLFTLSKSIQSQNNQVFDALLKIYVTADGKIDYKGLRKNKAVLDVYFDELNKTTSKKTWSSNKGKAFWLNVYNAYKLKIIIESYPIKKVTDFKLSGKNIWQLPIVKVGGKAYSLDHIEHKVLREWFKEPRVHVGLNAASVSGPNAVNFAFTKENVDKKLDVLMKNFINDATKNKITSNKVQISKMFDWYKEDFTSEGATLIDYLNKYSNIKIDDTAEVEFLEYDWLLNDKR